MSELKPCAACGSTNVSPKFPGDLTWIGCDDCWYTECYENWQDDCRTESTTKKRTDKLQATLATREEQLVEMCEAVDAMAYGQDGKRLTVKKCIRWAKKARALIKELDGK